MAERQREAALRYLPTNRRFRSKRDTIDYRWICCFQCYAESAIRTIGREAYYSILRNSPNILLGVETMTVTSRMGEMTKPLETKEYYVRNKPPRNKVEAAERQFDRIERQRKMRLLVANWRNAVFGQD